MVTHWDRVAGRRQVNLPQLITILNSEGSQVGVTGGSNEYQSGRRYHRVAHLHAAFDEVVKRPGHHFFKCTQGHTPKYLACLEIGRVQGGPGWPRVVQGREFPGWMSAHP